MRLLPFHSFVFIRGKVKLLLALLLTRIPN